MAAGRIVMGIAHTGIHLGSYALGSSNKYEVKGESVCLCARKKNILYYPSWQFFGKGLMPRME
jgi:hypothetical protein